MASSPAATLESTGSSSAAVTWGGGSSGTKRRSSPETSSRSRAPSRASRRPCASQRKTRCGSVGSVGSTRTCVARSICSVKRPTRTTPTKVPRASNTDCWTVITTLRSGARIQLGPVEIAPERSPSLRLPGGLFEGGAARWVYRRAIVAHRPCRERIGRPAFAHHGSPRAGPSFGAPRDDPRRRGRAGYADLPAACRGHDQAVVVVVAHRRPGEGHLGQRGSLDEAGEEGSLDAHRVIDADEAETRFLPEALRSVASDPEVARDGVLDPPRRRPSELVGAVEDGATRRCEERRQEDADRHQRSGGRPEEGRGEGETPRARHHAGPRYHVAGKPRAGEGVPSGDP